MDVERQIERLAVIADTSFLDHAAADDLREAAAALAKLQAERDEAIDEQFTVDENGVSIGWEEVAAMWRSRATHAEARAEKAEAERDEAREVLRPFKAAFEYSVTELPDDIQAIQLMRSRVGFKHFRAASRALGGGE